MKVSIHQPDFFPWLGLFHKINLSDKFIFFDHVQAPTGKHWTNRNKILVGTEIKWLTIPIRKRGRKFQKYSEILINYERDFIRKHLGTLRLAYSKTPHFKEIYNILEEIYTTKYEYLADFNKKFIQVIAEKLEIKVEFKNSSTLLKKYDNLDQLKGNDLIMLTCVESGAKEYISGQGCLDFIKPEEFERKGIKFIFQNFSHPEYKQKTNPRKEFISHLSSIDAFFNVGFKESKELIAKK